MTVTRHRFKDLYLGVAVGHSHSPITQNSTIPKLTKLTKDSDWVLNQWPQDSMSRQLH